MTGSDLFPAAVLRRKAVVYVRQSTQQQVQLNTESTRRQYELVEVARRRGFRDVEVIDTGRAATLRTTRIGSADRRAYRSAAVAKSGKQDSTQAWAR